jgi:hypothetical protein
MYLQVYSRLTIIAVPDCLAPHLIYYLVDFVVLRHSVVRLLGEKSGNLTTVYHITLTVTLLVG